LEDADPLILACLFFFPESQPTVTAADDSDLEWMTFLPSIGEDDHAPPSSTPTPFRGGQQAIPNNEAGNKPRSTFNGTRVGGSKRLQRKETSSMPSVVNKPTAKPNLVDMFGQKILQKAKDQAFALASKERWKRAELEDKKEARLVAEKRARIERHSAAKLAKEANKYNLLIELAKIGRPIDEMKAIMDMSDML
jgi:hypothetical protein